MIVTYILELTHDTKLVIEKRLVPLTLGAEYFNLIKVALVDYLISQSFLALQPTMSHLIG